jgi:acetoin utilization deacetylase AcuC-like enzyme
MSDQHEIAGEAGVMELAIVDDQSFDAHRAPFAHPERPERLAAARAALAAAAVPTRRVDVRRATRAELERVHATEYLDRLERLAGTRGELDADTYLAPGSVDAALRAAGGAVELVRDLMATGGRGVALLRPPGHHAKRERAMGFCLLNNIAVAAAEALARGMQRVAIVDWDVHHGNGTQDTFFEDPRVLFVSLHQWPFYPGTGGVYETGAGDGAGYNVNVPLSAGSGPNEYAAAFERLVLPVVESYAPEMILVSAGFDAHLDDPLANMNLDAQAYATMTMQLAAIADKTAGGKMGLFLEGGYDIAALQSSLTACMRVLASPEASARPREHGHISSTGELEIERARRALSPMWRSAV